MVGAELIVRLSGVAKDYRGLRPLRVEKLELRRAQSVALLGFDQSMAHVLIDLITGATLPDSGEVVVFGQSTAATTNADIWLKGLESFGLISERVVLVDQFTVEQNIAIPFTLEFDTLSTALRGRISLLAQRAGMRADLQGLTLGLPPLERQRLRLARALALDPPVVLAEHPTAALTAADGTLFAADLARAIGNGNTAMLVLTADSAFAKRITKDVFTLHPATGRFQPLSGWREWFS